MVKIKILADSIKKNEIMLFAGKWMEHENMLSQVSQAQMVKGIMYSLL
jgi:hypothetical protein